MSDATRVTMVFSDLAGSTKLGERLDPETLRVVLGRYFDEMRAVFAAHGGVIEKIIGDAIVAVFTPDDDAAGAALRAVSAVAETQATLDVLNEVIEARWGIRLTNRTGIATGDLLVERLAAGHSVLGGPVVAAAESMERASPHFESLLDEATHALVAARGEFTLHGEVPLKGTDTTIPAYLLVSVDAAKSADATTGAGGVTCPACGAGVPAGASRCPRCGAVARVSLETRRTVTILFADPKPHGTGGNQPAPATVQAAMSYFFDAMRPVLERHGATVETFIGDAVMAVFGLPTRREDDALRAVRAADEMRLALPTINAVTESRWGVALGCPIGVNSGEVVAGDASLGQRLVTGDTVNVAARLEQSAGAGEVLLGGLTMRLVRDAVAVEACEPLILKGKAEPVPAFRLLRVGAPSGRPPRLPMVGRDAELGALVGTLADAVASARLEAASVFGDAGVGKSRLLHEFVERAEADGALVVRGRCLPYGDGITFWPVTEIVRGLAAAGDNDSPALARARLAERLGSGSEDVVDRLASIAGMTGDTYSVSESFWAVRRLVEILAVERPVVVLLEDIHWAEETFLDLVGHLVDAVRDSRVAVVCATRRALLERHPDWASAEHHRRVMLEPLSDEHAARIIDNVLGDAGLGDAVRSRVLQAAEGNPLFVEQLLSMLVDDGRVSLVDGRWQVRGSLDDLAIPPSIHALLASRIDRLPEAERRVIEPASVVGKSFAADAVRHLVPDPEVRESLAERLEVLIARQIVAAGESGSEGEVFRFHHALLRDAAYQGLLKETRALFHEEFVVWADRVNAASGRGLEFEEILGFHLEQAFRYWIELGPRDERVDAVGRDGSRRLASAGHRAFARGDMPAAAGLLTRAGELLPPTDPGLPMLLLRAGEARFETGAFDVARDAVEAAAHLAAASGDLGGSAAAAVERLRIGYLTGAAGSTAEVEAEAAVLRATLEGADHAAGLARLWRLLTTIEVVGARFGAAEVAALEMVAQATRAGDAVMESRMLQNLAVLAPVGPTPVPEAIVRCEAILERVADDRRAAANTQRALAQLHALGGDLESARALYRRARATLEDLGWRHDAALVSLDSGPVELLVGDPAVAEADLRRDHGALKEMGDTFFIPTTAVFLGEAIFRQGRHDEAAGFATECAETADPDDLAPQVLWRTLQARIDAAAGRSVPAHRLAREAVELSEGSDGPTLRADALLALAAVMATSDREEAVRAAGQAAALYEAKASPAGLDRVRQVLEDLPALS